MQDDSLPISYSSLPMATSVDNPDRDDDLSRRVQAALERLRAGEAETKEILDDKDLMDSIRRSRKQRFERRERGTSLEDARREILGDDA